MANTERRATPRVRVTVPTYVIRGRTAEAVQMMDASFRGIFLCMDEPPPVMQLVKLQIDLPTGVLDVHGVVVRIVPDVRGQQGVALRFFAFRGTELARWEQFVAHAVRARTAA